MGPTAISVDVGSIPLVFQNYKIKCLDFITFILSAQLKNLNVQIAEIYKRLKIGGESLRNQT